MSTTTAGRDVGGLATTACVRVRDAAGAVVGSGFLVGPDLVATCAHVVADACRADPYSPSAPAADVALDFPMVGQGPAGRIARVHRWVPIADDGTGDVALLRLDAPAPPGAVMPPLRRVDRLWDHRFLVFGFPEGRWDGVWSTGRMRGGQGTGWVQLQSAPGDQPIEGGFSGAPVWHAETGAVVGMTVAADRDPAVTTAYLVPVQQVLGLDPELLPSPYRGLEPFGEEHAEFFFGREPEIAQLVAAVRRSPLAAVAGPSGAGKSSLIRAGLLPHLRREGARIVEVRARPGTPVLAEVVSAVRAPQDGTHDAHAVAAALADPATRPDAARVADGVRCVLLVDQFEELADAEPAAARELLAALAALTTAPGSQVRVVLTLRGTAIDEVLTPDAATALGAGTVFVGPLDRARLRSAVVGPAERAPGLAFEDGLVDRILDDAGIEPGRLPLVESLLAQLWSRREGGSLTMRGYEAAGGVAGALAAHAERVADTVRGPDGDDGPLRELCMRLAVIGRDGRARRRPVRLDELPDPLRAMVTVLAAARLVVVSGGTGGDVVDLAHHSLIDHWPRLRAWLEADREFLIWRSEAEAARDRWEQGGHDEGALLRGAALETANGWVAERPRDVGAGQAEYVRRSRVRQRREVRRWRAVAAVLAVLVLTAGVLTFVAVRGRAQLAAQLATANADVLARESGARLGRDPALAAELALAAWRSDPGSAAARTALADAYIAFAGTDSVVYSEPDRGPVLVITAAGETLISVTPEAGASLTTGVLGPDPAPVGLAEGVRFVRLGPDGSRLAVIGPDGVLRLRDLHARDRGVALTEPGAAPRLTGFSPDGSRLGWISGDVVHVHDIAAGTTTAPATVPAGTTGFHLTADPDLAVVETERGATVRSLATGAEVRTLPQGTTVAGAGAYTVTCVDAAASDPAAGAELVVRDAARGAELRRMRVQGGCLGLAHPFGGRYAVERLSSMADSPAEVNRALDLATGAAYQFVAPDLDRSVWDTGEAPAISVLPTRGGGVAAFVAVGPSVLRVPAAREPAGMRYDTRTATVPGGLLAAHRVTVQETRFTLHDPVTGALLAERSAVTGGGWTVDEGLWTLGHDGSGSHLDRYALPGLTPELRLPVPTRPDDLAATAGTASDGTAAVAIISAGGTVTAHDVRTGARLGEPVPMPAVTDPRLVWARRGHPGQAIVAAGPVLELWDVPAGRRLGSGDLEVVTFNGILAGGDTLVAVTAEGNLEVRTLPGMERVGDPIAAPEVQQLLGFDAEGRLVASTSALGDAQIVFWDLERRAEAGRMRPPGGAPSSVDGGPVSVDGSSGILPQALDLRADAWHAHLCRLLPGGPSDAAARLLPAGTDRTSPCA